MKKINYMVLVLALVCFPFFERLTFAVVPDPISLEDMGTVTINGKVESISRDCPLKGVMATIIIVDKMGKTMSIEAKADTKIYDKAGHSIVLDKVEKGDEVTIKYREVKKTAKQAKSIELKER